MDDEFDFRAYQEKLHRPGKWVYIAPVSGLLLSEAVDNEIRINRVAFISRSKLPYVRQRLGIPERISRLKEDQFRADFFESAETFAVVRHSEKPEEAKEFCRRLVKHELSILASSQLGFGSRWLNACPSIERGYHSGRVSELLLSEDGRNFLSGRHAGKLGDLHLGGVWKGWQKDGFFFGLIDVLNNRVVVEEGWRHDLERAAVLIGQSQCSTQLNQAFLWNVIALETLLTEWESNYRELLIERAEAFLGWVHHWSRRNYGKRIREVYRKRSKFVHNGNDADINVADVLFTDELLFNLLTNLIQHIDRFRSKDDIIDFTETVKAERVLGIETGVRPSTLSYQERAFSERDYREI